MDTNTLTSIFRTATRYLLQSKPEWKDFSSAELVDQVLKDSGLSMNGRQRTRLALLIDFDRGLS